MLSKLPFDGSCVVRRTDLISEDISGEYVVYDAKRKKAHHLNRTLSWIWRRCDGSNTVETLAASFEHEFEIRNSGEMICDGIRQLQACELLDTVPVLKPESNGTGISRRDVIAGGAVIWPAVASMVAPTAAAAKSNPGKHKGNDKGDDS